MLVLIHIFVLLGVIAYASARGGRYERAYGMLLLAMTAGGQLAQAGLRGQVLAVSFAILDLGALAWAVWLFRRHPAWWLGVGVAVQVIAAPLDWIYLTHLPKGPWGPDWRAFWWLQSVVAYTPAPVLVAAVLQRHYGPPYRVPQPG